MINPKTFRSALKALLDARSNLTAISARVFEYPPGKKADRRHPTIWFTRVADVSLEDQSLGGEQEAVYLFEGRGFTATAGSSDEDWERGENEAFTLIDELVDTLQDNSGAGGSNHVRVTTWQLDPTQDDQGNVFFDLEFTITALFFS